MKVDIDLTKTNPDNAISDELHTDVGSGAFYLEHDFFYGSTDLEIWTGQGQTGTQLTETTDYTLGDTNSDLTTRAGVTIYGSVTVINATYQTGDLYFTYHACADYIEASDVYDIERSNGSSIKLLEDGSVDIEASAGAGYYNYFKNASNWGMRIYGSEVSVGSWSSAAMMEANATTVRLINWTGGKVQLDCNSNSATDALDIDSEGGIDIDSGSAGITMDASGGPITLTAAAQSNALTLAVDGSTTLVSGSTEAVTIATANDESYLVLNADSAYALLYSELKVNLTSNGTDADSIDINSAGGIDIDAGGEAPTVLGGINITTTYGDTSGSGNDIVIEATNTFAGGTSGDVIVRTTGGPGSGGNIQISTDNTGTDAIDINATDGGLDVDIASNIVFTSTTGSISLEATDSTVSTSSRGFSVTSSTTDTTATEIVHTYTGTGTGGIMRFRSIVDNASGTGGSLYIQTSTLDGTAGKILIESANTASDAIDIESDGGIDVDASGIISLRSSGSYTELLGDVRIPTSAPGSPADGAIYLDTTAHRLYVYDTSAWRYVALTT